jgi:GLPGLI family protein
MMAANGSSMEKMCGTMDIAINLHVLCLKWNFRHFLDLLLCIFTLFCAKDITGQQVIVIYLGEEKVQAHYTEDGRFMDFPEQHIMATLRSTSKSSIWSQDSITFNRLGLFADGFTLRVPGIWEFRDKSSGYKLTHKLYYGTSEFVKSDLKDPIDPECSSWSVVKGVHKNILGIACQKAIRTCNGTEQVAFYAPSIAITDGPQVVSVLPGLILEMDDGKFHYTAQHISATEDDLTPPKPVILIRKDQHNPADSKLTISQENLSANTWIRMDTLYGITN